MHLPRQEPETRAVGILDPATYLQGLEQDFLKRALLP
jgi:hypothetical protein